MITIKYDPNWGVAVRDGEVEQRIADILWDTAHDTYELEYATENIFHALRLAVADGRLDYRRIQFQFKNGILPVDQYGDLTTNWPEGFCDRSALVSRALMLTASRKRIADRSR